MGAGGGLAEIGPIDELLLRGPGAIATVARLAIGAAPAVAGQSVPVDLHGDAGAAWLLGPDEVLLLGPSGTTWPDRLAAEVASRDVSAIEMTGARTTLRLAGRAAPAILAELCAADTTPSTMAPAALIQASLAGVRAFICREDATGHPGYTIMVARDEAAHVWDAIWRIGAAHALTVVGPAAVAPRGPA
jgi:sarcosine oxidase subunit gamma